MSYAPFEPDRPLAGEPPVTFAVRPALPQDLAAVEMIERRSGRSATAHSLAASVADPERLVVVAVAVAHHRVLGWAATHRWPEPDGDAPAGHYLTGVTVDPDHRRRGVGTALLQARLAWIAERAPEAYFFANARNLASLALHAPWGFVEIARAASFRSVPFDGGAGLLLRSPLERRSPQPS